MNYLDQILESWLPTRWSRVIAGLTIVIAGASIALPEFLQKFDIQLSKGNIVLIRVAVPLLILWLGTLVVLLIVVQNSALFKDQVMVLEKKIIDLEAKLIISEKEKSMLQVKIIDLEVKVQFLTKDNEELRQKIESDHQKHSKEMTELTEKYNREILKMRQKNGKAGSGLGPHL